MRTLRKVQAFLLVFSTAVLLLGAGGSVSNPHPVRAAPHQAGSLNLSPSSGPAGTSVSVSGTGWTNSNGPYKIFWNTKGGTELGSFNVSGGSFSTTVSIPSGASSGTHQIVACEGYTTEFESCSSSPFKVTPPTNTPVPPTITPIPSTPTSTFTSTFTPTPTLEACLDSAAVLSPEYSVDLGGAETTDLVIEVMYGGEGEPTVDFLFNNYDYEDPYTRWPDPEPGTNVEMEQDPTNPYRYVFTLKDVPLKRGQNDIYVVLSGSCAAPPEFYSNFENGAPYTPTPRADTCGGINFGTGTEVITFNSFSGYLDDLNEYGVVFGRLFDLYEPEAVLPRSGLYAGSSLGGGDFGHALHPIQMTFKQPLSAIGTYVGLEEVVDVDSEVTVVLTLYGLEGGTGSPVQLGTTSTSFPPEPTDIQHCLSFQAEEGDLITQASLEYVDAAGTSLVERRLMDDLTILLAEDAEVEDLPPEVTIENPEDGASIEEAELIARAVIDEDISLLDVDYRLNEGDWIDVPFSPDPASPSRHLTAVSLDADDLLYGRENTLEFRASDSARQEGTASVTFTYRSGAPVTVHDLDYDFTQSGVFDVEGFPSFLVAGKTGVLQVTGLPQIGGSLEPVSVDEAQLWMITDDDRRRLVLPHQRVGDEFEVVHPIPSGELELYYFIDGLSLHPAAYTFELVLKIEEETVYSEILGYPEFREIPPQYQFHAMVEDPLSGSGAAGFNAQMMEMPRLYPVSDGLALYGAPSTPTDPGIIYQVAPSVIDLPNGINPATGEETFAWDFIYDGPGNRARLNADKGVVDCNLDGVVDSTDRETKWLIGDGDGNFDTGTIDPPGHVQWDWNKPEDVNGDGVVTQDEIGLWVVEFIDLDGDGEWHDYTGSDRDLFSPGDPYHTYRDDNRNCQMDDSEKSSQAPGAQRKANAWGYVRRQAEMLMDEFAAANGLDRMATSAVFTDRRTSSLNVIGNCARGIVCWDTTRANSMVIAHELGHGWGIDHDSPRTFADGALNLKERRWIPEASTRNFMFWLVGNQPRENFASASSFQSLFDRGLGGWNYFGSSSSAAEPGGFLLASLLPRLQRQSTATFALYGSLSAEGELRIDQTRVYYQDLNPEQSNGPYRLVFLDQEGNTLDETSFSVVEEAVCDGCPEGEDTVAFEQPSVSVRASFPRETETVEIYHQDQLLRTLEVSLHAPEVEWDSPGSSTISRGQAAVLRWNGSDRDGDPLTYSLDYSVDGGSTWLPIASGLREPTYTWAFEDGPGGEHAVIRVTASDGFHSTRAESPALNLEKGSPSLSILTPSEGQEVGHRSTIILEAYAVDPEDGVLTGESLIWTDQNGDQLGSGAQVILEGYAQGEHTFTAAVVDQDANQAQQSVSVQVVESPPIPEAVVSGEIVLSSSTDTLAAGTCQPAKAAIQAEIPSEWEIEEVTLLIDREGVPGESIVMEPTAEGRYSAELSAPDDPEQATWTYAVIAAGKSGEFWSRPANLEIVNCAEEEAGQSPAEVGEDRPGILSRPILLAGVAATIVLLIAGAYWLVQKR